MIHSSHEDIYRMLANLRAELLNWLLIPTGVVSFYAVLILNLLLKREPFANMTTSFWIIAACLLSYRLKGTYPQLAAYIYVFGLTTAILALTWNLFVPVSMVLLPTLILITMAVLNTRSALTVAILATLVLMGAAGQHHQPNNATVAPLAAVWLTFFVAWLSNLNRVTAVEWAWNSYHQAHLASEEARTHRGELLRVHKALDEAYYRLERSNVQLTHAYEKAEEARRVKQQFVANVSHELRTPLNIIIGFSEAIALSPEAYGVRAVPRQLMGDINRIYRSARHLKRLIDDVLDLSQIDADHMPLMTEQASLTKIIHEATDMIKGIIVHKGLSLRVDIPKSVPPVFLDRLRVRQVLLNLLSNAVRFTDEGGITVSIQLKEDKLQVSVIDTGHGIPPDDMERVFEEFQQLDVSLTKRYEGTGLGLALSRRFIELHGGHLWAESELGKGSRFNFTLPLRPTGSYSKQIKSTSLPVASHVKARVGKTILVATEEPMAANFLKRHLRGYQIRSVATSELPEAVETYLPHAVIINDEFEQRDKDNRTLFHQFSPDEPLLRKELLSEGILDGEISSPLSPKNIGVPIITYPLPDPGHLSRMMGVDYYLVKPITRERLLTILATYGDRVSRILIIDDDIQLVELMARIIRAAPQTYKVDIACGGEEGWARLQDFQPDLVLLDLLMSELDGLTLLEFMRADDRLRETSVILITARDLPKANIRLPNQNRIKLEGPADFTSTQTLNSLQALLDSLPLPRLLSKRSPLPMLEAAQPNPQAS